MQAQPIEWGIQAAWDPEARLAWMDEYGFHAQVLYPNAVGIGGQILANDVHDPVLRQLCVEIYNDAMAELQEWSGNRFLPMPVMPAWNVDACVKEAQRIAALGFRGVNMTSDPQETGSPDFADPAWDPFWEACADLQLPVHFHIGASLTSLNFYGKYFWPSQHQNFKPAIGGAMLFLNNARVVINSVYAGIFDRFPKLKMVSVESGIGWVPFILEAADYQIMENAPSRRPSCRASRRSTSPTTGTPRSGSRPTTPTSRGSSTRSARTTSCSRPTSPPPPPTPKGLPRDPAQGARRERRAALSHLTLQGTLAASVGRQGSRGRARALSTARADPVSDQGRWPLARPPAGEDAEAVRLPRA